MKRSVLPTNKITSRDVKYGSVGEYLSLKLTPSGDIGVFNKGLSSIAKHSNHSERENYVHFGQQADKRMWTWLRVTINFKEVSSVLIEGPDPIEIFAEYLLWRANKANTDFLQQKIQLVLKKDKAQVGFSKINMHTYLLQLRFIIFWFCFSFSYGSVWLEFTMTSLLITVAATFLMTVNGQQYPYPYPNNGNFVNTGFPNIFPSTGNYLTSNRMPMITYMNSVMSPQNAQATGDVCK